jgi:hypothetical protein
VRLGFNVEALRGNKTVHFRSFHRLVPNDSDVLHPRALTLEEHHMERLNEEGNALTRYGRKLLILRDSETTELLRFPVHESNRYICSLQDIASILYLACEDPHLVLRNRVMQISCGLGVFGLLATLGVGILQGRHSAAVEKIRGAQDLLHLSEVNSVMFPTKQKIATAQSLLPHSVQSLTLTDVDEDALQLTTDNLHHLLSPTTEAYFSARQFDWRLHPRFNPTKPFYGGILSCNTPLEYPSAKQLARTVAHFLEPNGRFVHIAPTQQGGGSQEEDSLHFLSNFLHEGYLMSFDERLFTVESQFSEPQILDVEDVAPTNWKLETTNVNQFVALVAAHHADYDGFNGEYLFPMENGKFDNKEMDRHERRRLWQ